MLTTKRNPASPINRSTNQPDSPPTTPREKPTIAKIASHQRSSRLHLYRARINLSLGRTGPAALAIRRSASHAVTAAARHWHFNAYTKRRLTTALFCLVHDLGLPPGHLETFSQVYSFTPEFLDSIDRRSALLALTRLHHRVHSLVDDLDRAIEANPRPPGLQHVVDQIQSQPAPPAPSITTLGELRRITGQPLDSEYADHPLDCPDCLRARNDPTRSTSGIFSLSRPPCLAIQLM